MLFNKQQSIYFRRPLFLCFTAILASFALTVFLSGKEKIICALTLSALSLCSLLLFFLPSIRKKTVLFVAFTLFLTSVPLSLSYFQIDRRADSFSCDEVQEVTLYAKEMLSENSYGGTYRVHLTEIGGSAVSCDALMFIDSENKPKKNERIKLTAKISALRDEDFGTYYLADGLLVEVNAEEFLSFENCEGEYLSLQKPFVATVLSSIYEKTLGEEEGALVSALFLGEKSALHESTQLDVRRLGISHLIAVSGLHISILIYGLERLLRRLTVHRHIRSVACVLSLFAYLSVIGFPISAVRASLMYLLILLSYYLGSRYDSMSALAFVAVLLCFSSPYTVYDAGFWLSVMATGGVLAVVSKEEAKNPNALRVPEIPIRNLKTFLFRVLKPLSTYIKTSFLITFGAICATFPITAFLFGEMSVFAALATLLLSPLVTVLLYGAILLPLFSWVPLVSFLLKMTAKCALTVISYFSSFDFALISLKNPLVSYSILFLTFAFVFMKILPLRKKKHSRILGGALAFALIAVITLTVTLPMREKSVVYERNGSKESLFLSDRGEYSLFLFDTLESQSTVALLDSHERTYLHRLLLTNYTETLYIKLERLVSSVKTEEVLLPTPSTAVESMIAERVLSSLTPHGVRLSFYEKNRPLLLKDRVSWTDFNYSDNRQTFSLEVRGSRIVYAVPRKLDAAVSVKAQKLYAEADLLIFGRRWVENDESFRTDTALPSLKILINANSYGNVSIPDRDESSFEYYKAPISVRYHLP
ncbi:MAG: ComEC/Rec2 family competence protein [Clostridia bacterium]|nr:ComEC/Rec2 family competence protein [Clostridia bacterium]